MNGSFIGTLQASALALMLLATSATQAQSNTLPESTGDHVESSISMIPPQVSAESSAETPVLIWVHVPHTLRPVDNFIAFPYPMKPPTISKTIEPLETKRDYLLGMLFSIGYASRTNRSKPFMQAGWRWRYAYDAALQKSRLGEPATVIAAYSWCKDMLPYIKPEIERMNTIEEQRSARYFEAVNYFEHHGQEVENSATRAGMQAVDIRLNRDFQSKIKLKPGNWWITGTHRAPGLIYYWQLPVTIGEGIAQKIELTEENALLIQGGW